MTSSKAIAFALSIICGTAVAEDKNVTIVTADGNIDGKVTIHTEQLEECVIALPSAASLTPTVHAESKYMKEINGDPNKNEYVKCYTAEIEIPYMTQQKELVIVSSNTLHGGEPQKEIVNKKIPLVKKFVSDSNNGDAFANRSANEYYFTTAQKATDDVMAQATAWLKMQQQVMCTK